ncbi:chaperone NapD [Rhizobium cauense]|uniref:chaperone NapD n=1 Tax=Rhizobium cauense TaxID=1166683 RepID=UPI001C6EADCD|nr:chaperone NapD [Rhizobium cauense]MBW9115073.1 chaperone NapD [Rhizobium cauense]
MHEPPSHYHVSSAVVATIPSSTEAVLQALARMENVEIYGHGGGKIVVVIEGQSTGALGDRLSQISLLDGVIAANMVFEHVEEEMQDHDGASEEA